MNYELAKELKDAGFPQIGAVCNDDPASCCEHYSYYKHEIGKGGGRNDMPYYPTLLELIEACDVDLSLSRNSKMPYSTEPPENIWRAVASGALGEGTTPEEAVANLYFLLHIFGSSVSNK